MVNAVQRPLLDQVEIEKLRHIAERPVSRTPHPHDVEHRQYGDTRSVYRGYGLDYEESRPYQPGDEMRFMNWRLSARSNDLFMKVFREERRPSVFILVDRRQSMRFGSRSRLKVTQAARLSAYLAFLARQQNAPIGGVVLNKSAEWIPEACGEVAVYNLLSQSNAACPPLEDDNQKVSLDHTLRLLLSMLVRGSIIYLVSDFHDLSPLSHPILLQLSEEHRIIAINVTDEREKNLPNAAGLSIYNPEEDEDIQLDTSNKALHQQYHQRASAHFDAIKNSFSSCGISYIEIDSEADDFRSLVPDL